MAREIERKFLPRDERWRNDSGIAMCQGYLSSGGSASVRVRIAGDAAWLTIKGPTSGASRDEYEYDIPLSDARAMLDTLTTAPLVEKTRYRVDHGGLTWEVDEFSGANEGLVIAEVELLSEDQEFDRPDWVGEEVTGDPRYYNSSLARYPFTTWQR